VTYVTSLEDKVALVRRRLAGLLGQRIAGYERAELWIESDQAWSPWRDLPLVLLFERGACLSISWRAFDDLGIAEGRVLPFSLSGCTVRWVSDGAPALGEAVGHAVESVALASDAMRAERAMEAWTHLCVRLSNGGTLDLFNALDENGYAFVQGDVRSEDGPVALRVKACV
jgi:hypothetical protein